jgi:2-dehydropantoate 2-reductase
MRFVIVGAGAIGGWLGAGLARAGHEVAVLARGATLAALRRDGLRVREGDREARFTVTADERPLALGACDSVIVGLKAQDVAGIAPQLAPLLGLETTVVTIQNGLPWWFLDGTPLAGRTLASVDPGGATARAIPFARAIGGVVHGSTRVEAPGVIRIGKVDRLLLGEPQGNKSGGASPRIDRLVAAFKAGGVPAVASPDIRAELWAKLWGNMNMNPISALTQAGAADMLANPLLRELAAGMMREMEAVGAKLGLRLPMGVDDRIALTAKLGNFRTSMLQDLDAGRPLETEPILGVVVELADALAVPVPLSRGVLGLTRQLAASRGLVPPG